MAQTFVQYAGDGSTTTFAVPFQYIAKANVGVNVDAVQVSVTWINDQVIRLSTPPAAGSVVEVRRSTPGDAPLADFTDGSTLNAGELDLSAKQSTYLAQEAKDRAASGPGLTPLGNFDFQGRRSTNAADPEGPTDLVTKRWLDKTADEISGRVVFVFVEKETDGSESEAPARPYFIHHQTQAASVWIITHNLHTYPRPTVCGEDGNFILAEYTFSTLNELRLTFSEPRAGIAYVG